MGQVLRHRGPVEGLPVVLWNWQQASPVGTPLRLEVSAGDDAHRQAAMVGDILAGVGVQEVVVRAGATGVHATGVRALGLADSVAAGMRLLVCGLNPSIVAACEGIPFAGRGNRFWPAMVEAGLTDRARDVHHLLTAHGIGMTDLVKRPTPRAAELSAHEYRSGFERVERLARWLRPAAVCFVGLAGWRAAVDARARPGWQEGTAGGQPVYVMPSTSGLNARTPLTELAEHLRSAATGARGVTR